MPFLQIRQAFDQGSGRTVLLGTDIDEEEKRFERTHIEIDKLLTGLTSGGQHALADDIKSMLRGWSNGLNPETSICLNRLFENVTVLRYTGILCAKPK